MQFSKFWEGNVHYIVKDVLVSVICWVRVKITEIYSLDRHFLENVEDRFPNCPIKPAWSYIWSYKKYLNIKYFDTFKPWFLFNYFIMIFFNNLKNDLFWKLLPESAFCFLKLFLTNLRIDDSQMSCVHISVRKMLFIYKDIYLLARVKFECKKCQEKM